MPDADALLLYYPQMKSLKLDHELAEQVVKQGRSSTWRLYDDKDLTVNDEVELIDKVNPTNPSTWKTIGTARINSITQKRLGEIEPQDFDKVDEPLSKDEILEKYQHYYGPQVGNESPVKIVRFTFRPSRQSSNNDVISTALYKELKMYADGGSRGNPGPSASGFVLMDMNGNVVAKNGVYLGITTNNQAEYKALKFGLEEASKMGAQKIHVFMDSLLVVNQMLGVFKVKNRDLWPTHQAIKDMVATFKQVSFTHVPRELNKLADAEVNKTLDKELK